jgi:hypothetical protein
MTRSLNSLVLLSVHHIIMFYSWIHSDRWLFLFTRNFRHFNRNFLSINFKSSLFLIPDFLQIISISLYLQSFLPLFPRYYSYSTLISLSGSYFPLLILLCHHFYLIVVTHVHARLLELKPLLISFFHFNPSYIHWITTFGQIFGRITLVIIFFITDLLNFSLNGQLATNASHWPEKYFCICWY